MKPESNRVTATASECKKQKGCKMTTFENKSIVFATVLSYAYRKPEERSDLRELKLEEKSLTEDFTAMLWGLMIFYCGITGEKLDILEFISILTRLAFQHCMAEGDA